MIVILIIGALIAIIALITIIFCIHSALAIKDYTMYIIMTILATINAYILGRLIRIIIDTIQIL